MLHESALLMTPNRFSRAPYNPPKPQLPPLLPSPATPPLYDPRTTVTQQQTPFKPTIKLSYAKMQDRKAKGLCMFCDEHFTPGHQLKHKRVQIYVMDTVEHTEADCEDLLPPACHADDNPDSIPVISLNALEGSTTFHCMRLTGYVGKKMIYILIDPGSSHNFLDEKVAQDIGCPLVPAPTYRVNAAFGSQMTFTHKCSSFTWTTQGYSFTTEIRTLPLDCCDLILGVQWLITVGPILWDFSNLLMEFHFQGLKHVLRGVSKNNFKFVKGRSLNKILSCGPQIAFFTCPVTQNHWPTC